MSGIRTMKELDRLRAEVVRLNSEVDRLTAEASADYQDGYDQGNVDGQNDAAGQIESLEAKLERVESALTGHPRACDRNRDDSPIACGWKRTVLDVQRALEGDA